MRTFSRVVVALSVAVATVFSGVALAAPASAAIITAPVLLTPAASSLTDASVDFTWAAGTADTPLEYQVRYAANPNVNGAGRLTAVLGVSLPFTTGTTASSTLALGGTRYWQIGYREVGSPTTTWTPIVQFTADVLPPIVVETSSGQTEFGPDWDYLFEATVLDTHDYTYSIAVDGNPVSGASGSGVAGSTTISEALLVTGLSTGTHTTSIEVEDLAGNNWTYTRDITIDATAPVITYSTPTPPTPLVGASVAIAGTAVDAEGYQEAAGALDFAIAPYNGSVCGTPTIVTGTIDAAGAFSATFNSTTLPDGNYCITPLVEDTWGNASSAFLVVSIDNVLSTLPAGPSLPTMGANPAAALLFSGFALLAGLGLFLGSRRRVTPGA